MWKVTVVVRSRGDALDASRFIDTYEDLVIEAESLEKAIREADRLLKSIAQKARQTDNDWAVEEIHELPVLAEAHKEGLRDGRAHGYTAGFTAGFDDGRNVGRGESYNDGRAAGYRQCRDERDIHIS